MSILKALEERSKHSCELCGATDNLAVYTPAPATHETLASGRWAGSACTSQIHKRGAPAATRRRCPTDRGWRQPPAVKIVAWRMLTRLRAEGWPQDLLDMFYIDEETLALARATGEGEEAAPKHVDSNGAELSAGDSVVLIKDLDVKGSSLTAKRGTTVRNIRLDPDNNEFIEGKVDGQQIVILTKYVKKA